MVEPAGQLPETTDAEDLYFLGQSAPGVPTRRVDGLAFQGRINSYAGTNPEGNLAASEGTIVRGTDGRVWDKVTGGTSNTGWRERASKTANRTLEEIVFANDDDPQIDPQSDIIAMTRTQIVKGESYLNDNIDLRLGRALDGWWDLTVKAESGATTNNATPVALDVAGLRIPGPLLSSLWDTPDIDRLILRMDVEANSNAAAPVFAGTSGLAFYSTGGGGSDYPPLGLLPIDNTNFKKGGIDGCVCVNEGRSKSTALFAFTLQDFGGGTFVAGRLLSPDAIASQFIGDGNPQSFLRAGAGVQDNLTAFVTPPDNPLTDGLTVAPYLTFGAGTHGADAIINARLRLEMIEVPAANVFSP